MRAIGRLLRLSLAPSAVADVAAGIIFACEGRWPEQTSVFWLLAASFCVYHGAMALNDWRDREHDSRTRPSRPIPSGAVRPSTALGLGVVLLVLGPVLASQHSFHAGLWTLGLALAALAYDLIGRGPRLGPLLLALCRAGNLGLGLCFAHGEFLQTLGMHRALMPMLLYGVYVLRVSQLGRLEDGEDRDLGGSKPRALVLSSALMLAFVAFLPPYDLEVHTLAGRAAAAAICLPAAITLGKFARRSGAWTRGDVEQAMGLCLRRLLMFSAALAALAWHPPRWDATVVVALVLSGYVVASRLRRVFPPS